MSLLFTGAAIGISGAFTWLVDRRRQRLAQYVDTKSSEPSLSGRDEHGDDERPVSDTIFTKRSIWISSVAALAFALGSVMAVTGGTWMVVQRRRSGARRHRSAA